MLCVLQLKLWKNISTIAVSKAKKIPTNELKNSTPKNPGVNHRLRAISQTEKGLPMNFEDDIEDFELDVTNAGMAFDDHERELRAKKHVQAIKIVERKYFKKAKEPNMLSWEEKEQMRYLHNSNPEEWDVFRLAESFPVSRIGVKKILKANWNLRDRKQILKYNESVKRNWKLLEDGKLDIGEKLKMHLMKFVSRKEAQVASSDILQTSNSGTPLPKELHSGGDTIVDTGRLNAEKQRKEHHKHQQQENKKSELPGTYKIGDSHYDREDGEFLFRVPGMNS